MENLQYGVFGQENQNANYDFDLNQSQDSQPIGDVMYDGADFSDADIERMTEREYFNYLRSQDDMI